MVTKKRAPGAITSFLIRSITPPHRKVLNALKASTGNATDSGAILHAVVMCQDERQRRIDAEQERDAIEAKAATLVDALTRWREADKDISKAVKALGDVKNAAFIRSMH